MGTEGVSSLLRGWLNLNFLPMGTSLAQLRHEMLTVERDGLLRGDRFSFYAPRGGDDGSVRSPNQLILPSFGSEMQNEC